MQKIMRNNIKKIMLLIIMLFTLIINVNAQSVGGITSGAASYCSGANSGFVSLTGYVGTILFWESSTTGGVPWTNLPNPTSTQSYLNLTQTTYYRAVVQDGAFPADTSTISAITIFPPAIGGVISGGGSFCLGSGSGTLTLSGDTGNVINWLVSTNNGFSWTPITNTTNTLNYPNITQNTLYAAVIENEVTCPRDTSVYASFIIDITTVTGNYLSNDSILCSGINLDTIKLTGNVGGITDWISSIDNGATWNSVGNLTDTLTYLNLTQTIWYQTIIQNGTCPADTTTPIKLTVMTPNPVDAGEDEDIVQFETVTLNGVGVGSPLWSPSDGLDDPNIFTPLAKPLYTTTYVLTLTDSNFCVSQDSMVISVGVPIPNAITPNGDDANDFFIINKIDSLPNNTLKIYNRYGNIVFEESPYTNSWKGQSNGGGDLPDGIYYYTLDFGDGREARIGSILIKR